MLLNIWIDYAFEKIWIGNKIYHFWTGSILIKIFSESFYSENMKYLIGIYDWTQPYFQQGQETSFWILGSPSNLCIAGMLYIFFNIPFLFINSGIERKWSIDFFSSIRTHWLAIPIPYEPGNNNQEKNWDLYRISWVGTLTFGFKKMKSPGPGDFGFGKHILIANIFSSVSLRIHYGYQNGNRNILCYCKNSMFSLWSVSLNLLRLWEFRIC